MLQNKQEYLFNQILDLAERFENSSDARRHRIASELIRLSEFVMAAEKLERQECGWTEQEVIEVLLTLDRPIGSK